MNFWPPVQANGGNTVRTMIEPKEQFADVSVKRLAAVYAEALLNAADAAGQSRQMFEEIDSLIDDVFKNDTRLETLFAGAAVGRKVRQEAIDKVFKGRASGIFWNFLRVLNDHDRLDLIRPIRRALHDLSDERAHRLRVHVFSAIDLPEEYKNRIAEAVRQRFGLEPVLELHVDKSLLGGIMIRIGDKVYDATVRTKITNVRNQLIASSSHEIQSRRDRFSSAE
jgi:F-type H+-transporting ATPase subunit delta